LEKINSEYRKYHLTFNSEYRKVSAWRDFPPRRTAADQWKGLYMQSFSWAPEHSSALKDYVVAGMSFSEAADALNAKFGTAYTRNAVLGRAKRMKLVVPARPERGPRLKQPKRAKAPRKPRSGRSGEPGTTAPVAERPAPPKLRCVGITPRLIALVDLKAGECHYPYGGDRDGEPITFCGHPCFRGSVYCAPHFHLTRGPAIESERPTGPFVLRLVDAA
jgi:GcrA cell cycle regulator